MHYFDDYFYLFRFYTKVLWDSDVRFIFPWNAKNKYLGCLIWIIVLKRNTLGDAHCKIVSDLLTSWVSWEWEYTFLSI